MGIVRVLNAFVTAEELSSHGAMCSSAHRTHKWKQQTPLVKKHQVSVMCRPCNRSFGSQDALNSHNKAKHSGKSVPVTKRRRPRNNANGVQVKRKGGFQSITQNRTPTKRGRSPNNGPGVEI